MKHCTSKETIRPQTVCPRCQQAFVCGAESNTPEVSDSQINTPTCHCFTTSLTAQQRQFLAERWQGCLCQTCLSEIKQ